MKNEIEVKFYPVDVANIQEKLKKLGAQLIQQRTKMRRVIFGRESNPQLSVNYIRVRDEGKRIYISAKINATADGTIEDQKELQVNVPKFEDAVELLEVAGLSKTNYQENYRETWQLGDTEIVIDEWPLLKPYIEIEGMNIASLQSIANGLGLIWDQHSVVSTDELLASELGISKEEALDKMKDLRLK